MLSPFPVDSSGIQRPLEKFRYEGDALKLLMKVETFKDHKSNAIEFERYAKRSLEAVQGANKKVVDLSDYLNVNSGAVSALREAITLFRKEWGKEDCKLTDEHYVKYGQLLTTTLDMELEGKV